MARSHYRRPWQLPSETKQTQTRRPPPSSRPTTTHRLPGLRLTLLLPLFPRHFSIVLLLLLLSYNTLPARTKRAPRATATRARINRETRRARPRGKKPVIAGLAIESSEREREIVNAQSAAFCRRYRTRKSERDCDCRARARFVCLSFSSFTEGRLKGKLRWLSVIHCLVSLGRRTR